jgi:hypothetical protein
LQNAAKRFQSKDDLAVEYWCDPSKFPSESDPNRFARKIRWTLSKEERLTLSTPTGTLVFRFYSDLTYAEIEKSTSLTKDLHSFKKDIAFQWAETIARICGPDQLNQELPHYGENNDDELRDYLQVVHFHSREAEKQRKQAGEPRVRKPGHTRHASLDVSLQELTPEGSTTGVKKSVLRRSQSTGSGENTERPPSILRPGMKKSVLRRSQSTGSGENTEVPPSIPRPTSRSLRRALSLSTLKEKEDNAADMDDPPSIV